MYCHETEHYIFHYEHGSKAEQDIICIATVQEASYRYISTMLGVSMKEKIHYYLYHSSEEVGRECERRFGAYTPYNGCTVSENEILAVYNEETQCIGIHEDTHILMFTRGFSESSFLEEGVACAMDGLWWGIDNNAWVSYYRKNELCPSVTELLLLPRDNFYVVEDRIAYPLAGSFVSYLLMRFGKDIFHQFYLAKDYSMADKIILGYSLGELEEDFFQYIDLLSYDETIYARIKALLNELT